MTLKNFLERCLVVDLRAIARCQELRLQSMLKADIISQLERKIPDSVMARAYEKQLPEAALSALGTLVDANGSMRLGELEARFGQLRPARQGAVEKLQPWGDSLTTPLDYLHVWGLLFRLSTPEGDLAVIPTDLLEKLQPSGITRPRVFRNCAAPAVVVGASPYFCHDVLLLASALADASAARLATGGLSRRDVLRLNACFLAPDEIIDSRGERLARRFFFVRTLSERIELISLSDGRFVPGQGLHDWLAAPHQQRILGVVSAYPDHIEWSEWDDVPGVQVAAGPKTGCLSAARKFLMRLLSEAEPGEWNSINSLVHTARSRNSFLVRSPDDGTVFRCAQTGRTLTFRDWSLVEGAWIEAAMRGPLHWLGLVDIGKSRRGETTAFRIQDHAVPILRAAAADDRALAVEGLKQLPADIRVERSIEVDEDLVVRVSVDTPFHHWYLIERICELLERSQISRYRVSREKVRQRLQAGETCESILDTLGPDVPESVRTMIGNWANRFGQVRLFATSVLSAAEPALIAELRAVDEIAACLGRTLGSRASAISPGCEADLINALRRRGEMPHVELDIKPTLPPGSWVEIQTALGAWDRIARRTGSPGPSEATCRAVDALVAAHAARTPSELSSEIAERPAGVAALEDAVRCRRSITFEYRLPENSALIEHSSQESSARIVVLPRSIEQHKGITYLAGYRKGGSALDRFRIDCIFNAGPVQNRDAEEQIESCARSAKSAKIV